MSPNSAIRPASFDRVARLYRWAEHLLMGTSLRRCREAFLPELGSAKQALLLGDGDGRFLASLLRRNPLLHAVAIDSSSRMLELLTSRCSTHRVSTLQHCLPDLPWTRLPQPDLVVSHFVLDCLSQVQVDSLVQQTAAHVPRGTLWVISDFAIPQTQPWTTIGSTWVRGLYLAFRILTGLQVRHLPAIAGPMQRAGFRCLARREMLHGLLFSELWQSGPKPAPAG